MELADRRIAGEFTANWKLIIFSTKKEFQIIRWLVRIIHVVISTYHIGEYSRAFESVRNKSIDISFLNSPRIRRSANWRRIRGELGSHYFSSKNVFQIILWLGRVIDNMNQGICTWERQLRSKTTAENVLCFHNFWWICFDFSENLIEK